MISKWRLQAILLLSLFFTTGVTAKPFIEAEIRGQLGNNLFIVATAYALAWDNNCEAYFPELQVNCAGGVKNLVSNLNHIFYRCNFSQPPSSIKTHWSEPSFTYHKIPFQDGMKIHGYFQSEKYFAHYRDKILELFAPHPDDLKYIKTKFKWILDHPNTVSIQVRKYFEDPQGNKHIQYGKDYLRKAMNIFPKDALFILFSNDMEFAKKNIPDEMLSRVKCIENEPHYIDLHLASLCKHNIVSNSSFGWWGAWLNKNPNKKVISPGLFCHPQSNVPSYDYYPKRWITITAKWGPCTQPTTYQ